MIRVFKTGRHAHRTPLSYPALAPLFRDTVILTDTPEEADLYLFAHVLDIAAAPEAMVSDWRRRRRPVVLLSEEPFWDTIWGGRPLVRTFFQESSYGMLPVIQLNHHTTDIFRFERIPYYLLTDHAIPPAYALRFERNARRDGAAFRADHAQRAIDASFMFERRPEARHDRRWPQAGIIGLCAWRTRMAELCDWDGTERLGRSWHGGPSRFQLTNWHLDKLLQLDGRARAIGAFENTHQPDYVSEKIFDAFACGAFPLYYAAPGQGVHRLGLPAQSWLNFHDMTPEAAADFLRDHQPGPEAFEALAEAQRVLAALIADTGAFVSERARLQRSVLQALQAVLDGA